MMNKHGKIVVVMFALAALLYRSITWRIIAVTLLGTLAIEVIEYLLKFSKKADSANVDDDIYSELK